jgi:hypothetical protein
MPQKNPKRFGQVAVEKGFLDEEQIHEALEIQAREKEEKGTHRLVGAILVDLGYLTEEQKDEILETMNNRMMYMLALGT